MNPDVVICIKKAGKRQQNTKKNKKCVSVLFIDMILSLFLCWDRFEGASWGNASSTSLILPVYVIIHMNVCERENIHCVTLQKQVISSHIQSY